jgi:hypothetical protein
MMAYDWQAIAKEKGFDSPTLMLQKMYVTDGYTIGDIAALLGCSSYAISTIIAKCGIPRQQHGGARRAKGKPSIAAIENVLQKLQKEAK